MQAKIASQTNFEGIQLKELNRSKYLSKYNKLGINREFCDPTWGDQRVDRALG